jgi:hypothetical protein
VLQYISQPGLLKDLDITKAEEVKVFVKNIDILLGISGKSEVLYTSGFSVSAVSDLLICCRDIRVFSDKYGSV